MENWETLLRSAHTIAVLGASSRPDRPAFFVPDYLYRTGYRILPVNPAQVGQRLWGEPVVGSLGELHQDIDVLDVFRRSEVLFEHLDDILQAKPKLVWLQSGIRNDAFAARLEAAGIAVVQDRCLMVEHRRRLGQSSQARGLGQSSSGTE
ncbi:CoA-binding protein [Meiothermus granaticius]|nr:CoA-binding protein [Meiothermus granaticius]GEM86894.1 CoA-binding protein [Meiothermus granaticius NBRC 107808]